MGERSSYELAGSQVCAGGQLHGSYAMQQNPSPPFLGPSDMLTGIHSLFAGFTIVRSR